VLGSTTATRSPIRTATLWSAFSATSPTRQFAVRPVYLLGRAQVAAHVRLVCLLPHSYEPGAGAFLVPPERFLQMCAEITCSLHVSTPADLLSPFLPGI